MSGAGAGRARLPLGTLALLALAGVLYAGMAGSLAGAPQSDAFGRGMGLAFGMLFGAVLWLDLAALLALAAAQGRMPVPGQLAAMVLVPLSAVAAALAADAYVARDASAIWVPVLLPPLIVLYAVWARFPRLHAALPAMPTGAVLGGAVLLLSLVPVVAALRPPQPGPARDAGSAAGAGQAHPGQRQAEEVRAREEAQFAALGPGSSLGDYLVYYRMARFSKPALAGIRQVGSRQSDAVALLRERPLVELQDLWRFDLEPAPELCRAFSDALGGAAAQVSPQARSDYLSAAIALEGQLPNIRWLVGAQCDLDRPLALLEGNVRAVADSQRMAGFADTLAGLRRAR